MNQGIIVEAAREDNRGFRAFWISLMGLCLIIFALNWSYLYNAFAGPVPFTPAFAANPGHRDFVRLSEKLISTGMVEETHFKLKKVHLPGTVTAKYKAALVGDKTLLVKTDADATEQAALLGRLEPIPNDLPDEVKNSKTFYPWLFVATSNYWLTGNLFILLALLLFPLALIFWLLTVWKGADVSRLGAIKALKSHGSPLEVVQKIEAEITRGAPGNHIGHSYFTKCWMVTLKPLLEIIPIEDVMAVAPHREFKKVGTEVTFTDLIRIWRRGRVRPNEWKVHENQVEPTLKKIAEQYPWITIANSNEYTERWNLSRAEREKEADALKTRRPVT